VRRIFLLATALFLAVTPAIATAQGRDITGKVTQGEIGTPVPEAIITIVGQTLGVRTNALGEYRLRVPAGEAQILVRAIGFKRQTARVAGATQDFKLEGVTVTGQATTVDRRNASTAIASVSAEDLVKSPAKSLEGSLAGKVVGANVFENSGAPGGGMQIQIRGATSILGQGDPLYVVDGVIVSNASIGSGLAAISRSSGSTTSNQDQVVNRLADLNPNDIESLEVLKSAAATAIYGSRATNGVVVITTKRGRSGQTRFNITQRVGTQAMAKNLSSRKFATAADAAPYAGGAPGDSAIAANCTPSCPWYDWQGQLYAKHDPSFETVLSANGGLNNTRYFASINDRQESGIQFNTGTRRTSGRLNLDQSIGEKVTVSGGIDVTHNFLQRGIGNNENAGISPIYQFGYAPAVVDLTQKLANGHYVNMPFNGGGSSTANPFEVLSQITANEDVWRQTANLRLNYAAYSSSKNTVMLNYIGGLDRFSQDGFVYSPNFLQFEGGDTFFGTSQHVFATSRNINQSVNGVWTFTPGWSWMNSAQTSFGSTNETQLVNQNLIRYRGLIPTVVVPVGGTDLAVNDNRQELRDQSVYLNEQLVLLGEKLSLSAGVRADRSSANGDRKKFYAFPKVSASYRFEKPLEKWTSLINDTKLRVAWGQSGNRPRFADRDVLLATPGLIGGNSALTSASAVGNPSIKPEVMNELEFGIDATLWNERVAIEATSYERKIKDLLLTYALPPSSGLGTKTINGGQMSVKGFEAGITIVPIRRANLEWTFRTTYNQNVNHTDSIPVAPFNAPNSFGVSYGRNRIVANTVSTLIWGNAPLGVGGAVRDTILGDSNPRHQTQFLNQVTWGRFGFTGLLDWRNGGMTSTMTKNLFDEGGQSRDFDDPSPVAGTKLGDYRYNTFAAGDIRPYVEDGTYLKLREVTLTYEAPRTWANLARARDMRVTLGGRNLAMWSKYWSYDPEFNNFGNQNFNRFIDLAPYPSTRSFFFSIELGY
jgi:TonB-linked SusC/RagA family outer membrane protein